MTVLTSLKQLLGGASAAIQNVRRAEGGIREGLDELTREEGALLSQPAPRAEVEENLAALVADLGRRWTSVHGMEVVHGAAGYISVDVLVPPRPLDEILSGVVSLDLLAALCPTVLLEGLRRVVQETAYQPGPAMGSRLARLAEIQGERETLQRRHADLVDEAQAAGVTLEHLPETIGARFQRAQLHAAWERDGAANETHYRKNPSARPPEPPR